MECSEQIERVNKWTVLVSTTRWKVFESGGEGAKRFGKRGEEGVAPLVHSRRGAGCEGCQNKCRIRSNRAAGLCREERLLTTHAFAATRDCEAQQINHT